MLTPHKSPLHLWGAELRALRDRHGLSLAELGSSVFYDPSHLGKFERGERVPPRHIAEVCDRRLGGTGELVRLWEAMQQPADGGADEAVQAGHEAKSPPDGAKTALLVAPDSHDPSAWTGSDSDDIVHVAALTPDGRTVYVAISRRLILRSIGGAAVGTATVPTLQALAAAAGTTAVSLPDVHPVEHFQQMRRVLADSDNLFGPGRVITAVHEQIGIIHHASQHIRGTDRGRLLDVQVEYADLAGWLHQDCGDYPAAQYWLDRALEWSHLAGSRESTAFILARKAQLAGDMGEPAVAVDIAEAAIRMVEPTSRFAAIAATYAAHGHALRGDRESCRREYDHARGILTDAVADDLPWGQFFDPAYIDVQRAYSLEALGDHQSAAAAFEQTITALAPGFHRDRGVYLARAALAHAGAGDPEQATTRGLQALAIGRQTSSRRINLTLAKLRTSTVQWRRLPSVASLHQALDALHDPKEST